VDAAELAFAGIARQARLIRDGEISSRELVELYVERMERLGQRLNCFTDVFPERALAAADAADGRLASGEEAPLLGVPVAIKDIVDVEGFVTQFGTRAFDDPAAADGEIVRRLRAAGAVVIAKTTLPELAICAFTESEGWGITRNPWNTDRSPAGRAAAAGRRSPPGSSGRLQRPTVAARSGSRRRSAACSG
jgi:amidase